jgi:hypothetical protein
MPSKKQKEFFEKIPQDVPAFTLVATDPLAKATCDFWLRLARALGVNGNKLSRSNADIEAIAKFAVDHPDRMKIPD